VKLEDRKWYPYVILLIFYGVAAFWFHLGPGRQPQLLLTAVGGIAGLGYFLYRQHIDETKLFKDLFNEFNSRYDALKDHLNGMISGSPASLLSAQERDRLFAYFNLCAEEYFFYKAGYIDKRVWDSWSGGMKVFFKDQRIRKLWEEENQTGSYYGFRPPL